MNSKRGSIIIVVLVVLFLCLCLFVSTIGGYFLLRSDPTPAPVSSPVSVPTLAPTALPLPTQIPPTIEPTTDLIPLPANYPFVLDGVELQLYSVQYSLINGGEFGAYYPTNPNEFYLLLGLTSPTKDLSFFYDNYMSSLYLYDPTSGSIIYPDYFHWSIEESETNRGYIQISFPITAAPSQAVLRIADGLEIELTTALPEEVSANNPWLDVTQPITIDGYNLSFDSVTIYDEFTSYDGTPIQKTDPSDKILVIKLISDSADMSVADNWDNFMIIDNQNIDNQYFHYERSWSTTEGYVYFVFVIPNNTSAYTLYLPFETLIDLSPITEFGY